MKAIYVPPLVVLCLLHLATTSLLVAQEPAATSSRPSATSAWDRIAPREPLQPPASPADLALRASGRVPPGGESIGMLPGEFEWHHAMLLACGPMVESLPELFVNLVQRLAGRMEVVALVDGSKGRDAAIKLLTRHKVSAQHIHFVNLRHNSMWARDFGPHAVRGPEGRWSLVDAIYTCPDRSADDDVPMALGKSLHMPLVRGDLRIDGGNLLSNGRGLLVATVALAQRNMLPGVTADAVRRQLGEQYGAREVVFLEPLVGEPTAHVDMFATFTAADTIVVAQLDPRVDFENAAVLDRNAARLGSMRSGGKRLRVVRIPMPAHDDAIWRTYTNVVYANGLMLVPTCGDADQLGSETALATYKRLLPEWRVEAIDSEPLLALGGALHCVTMNLGRIDRLPHWNEDIPSPTREGDAPRRGEPRFETAPLERVLPLYGTENGVRLSR